MKNDSIASIVAGVIGVFALALFILMAFSGCASPAPAQTSREDLGFPEYLTVSQIEDSINTEYAKMKLDLLIDGSAKCDDYRYGGAPLVSGSDPENEFGADYIDITKFDDEAGEWFLYRYFFIEKYDMIVGVKYANAENERGINTIGLGGPSEFLGWNYNSGNERSNGAKEVAALNDLCEKVGVEY